ncbi:hypothetical protein CWD94_10040 [Lysinibacillus xylanilyticus]|uniref:Uncharacterized protein n=1 Tax=Lysinibacillus xylanilyticus TaxID=582475 RepID=A0A2M9Q793_9BACI|nr:hypothetical protein CWD94_10040 [Lysinibacillus xylanilyticus]
MQEKAKVTPDDVSNALEASKFTKSQIVKSNKYMARCDALNALLEADKSYSFTEVDGILKKFDKGGK